MGGPPEPLGGAQARPLGGATVYMVEVRAGDWPALCAFYGGTLGLPEKMVDGEGRFAMFGSKEPFIAVVDRGPVPSTGSRVVIDFAVDDLDGVLASLRARGVRVEAGPEASPEGYRLARVADPEGNEIHLFEWTAAPGPA